MTLATREKLKADDFTMDFTMLGDVWGDFITPLPLPLTAARTRLRPETADPGAGARGTDRVGCMVGGWFVGWLIVDIC